MSRLQKFIAMTALVLGSMASAHAADPPFPSPFENEPMMVEEYGTGWYLRGDIGFRQNSLGSAAIELPPFYPTNNRLNDSLTFGGGAGFKYGWFRGDLTLDQASMIYKSDTSISDDYRMKIDSFVALFNAYIDIGTWKRFTPYVGGGIGASYVTTLHYTSQMYPTATPVDVNRTWNFAWALMAGVAYQLSNSWLIDVGYRYLSYGNAITEYDVLRNRISIKDLTGHEARVGLRFAFD